MVSIFPKIEFTYAIEPHANAASKKPWSDIERAVGDARPYVSILVGNEFYSFFSTLNKPVSEVEKKNVY